MTNTPLFILGAGSSVQYGFPCGDSIIPLFADYINRHFTMEHPMFIESNSLINKFINHLLDSGVSSIDMSARLNTTDYHNLARPLFLNYILSLEDTGILNTNGWYIRLLQFLYRQFNNRVDHNSTINIITFNYDRSLDYFLYKKSIHGIDDRSKHFDFRNSFKISHVYNSIYPFLKSSTHDYIEYGAKSDFLDFNINPYHACRFSGFRYMDETHELINFKNMILNASEIHFMGFAYDPANLDYLGFNELFRNHSDIMTRKPISGTFFGENVSINHKKNTKLYFPNGIELYDMNCNDYFNKIVA